MLRSNRLFSTSSRTPSASFTLGRYMPASRRHWESRSATVNVPRSLRTNTRIVSLAGIFGICFDSSICSRMLICPVACGISAK